MAMEALKWLRVVKTVDIFDSLTTNHSGCNTSKHVNTQGKWCLKQEMTCSLTAIFLPFSTLPGLKSRTEPSHQQSASTRYYDGTPFASLRYPQSLDFKEHPAMMGSS